MLEQCFLKNSRLHAKIAVIESELITKSNMKSHLGRLSLYFYCCRTIAIPASAFDSKTKFLEETRKSFQGGTFSINSVPAGLLEKYHNFLKEEYYEDITPKKYFAAATIGLQKELLEEEYWCLSPEVCQHKFNTELPISNKFSNVFNSVINKCY